MGGGTEPGHHGGRTKKLIDLAHAFCKGGDAQPLPGNRDIWELLQLAATQWRAGFSGVYGLDYTAVIAIAQALDIQTDRTFFEKVRIFEKAVLENLSVGTRSTVSLQCNDAQKEVCKLEHGEYLEWACKNCGGGVKCYKTK